MNCDQPKMDILWTLCYVMVFLVHTEAMHFKSGFANRKRLLQTDFVSADLRACIDKSIRVSYCQGTFLVTLLKCMDIRVLTCIQKHGDNIEWNDSSGISLRFPADYCGFISLNENEAAFVRIILHIRFRTHYLVNIDILHFNFDWLHPNCGQHSVSVVDLIIKSTVPFCGRRLSWNLMATGNEVDVIITTQPLYSYLVTMFFSSYQFAWIDSFAVKKSLSFTTRFFTDFDGFQTNINSKTLIFKFNILSHVEKRVQIELTSTDELTSGIAIYDGPGNLSNDIIDFHDIITKKRKLALSSAFHASIHVVYSAVANVIFRIRSISHTSDLKYCAKRKPGHVYVTSSAVRNTVCNGLFSSGGESVDYVYFSSYAAVFIHRFHFSGPSHVSHHPDYNCEYGGIYVRFRRKKGFFRIFPICESRSNFLIYGDHVYTSILVVWYAGYSFGSLSASLERSHCFVQYLEFNHKGNGGIDDDVVVDDQVVCQSYICSPLTSHHQNQCRFSIRAPGRAIGTAFILISQASTLGRCMPEIARYRDNPIYNITAAFSPTWPLGGVHYDKLSLNASTVWNKTFFHLDNGTVSMPYICTKERQGRQMFLVIQVSTCQVSPNSMFVVRPLANIDSLSSHCIGYNYIMRGDKVNASHLIHKEHDSLIKGTFFSVKYSSKHGECPIRCKKYTYSVFVLSRDKSQVYEYVKDVGTKFYPGYFHHGLRMTINPPKDPCEDIEPCLISVFMYKNAFPVGISGTKSVTRIYVDENVWYFYGKR